jgi:protease IV
MFSLLLILLAGSILLNFLLAGSSFGTSKNVITTVFTPGNSHEQIAVIPLEGLIDGTQEARFNRFMDHARDDADVKAVIILIDTPGGSVTASDEIYKRIKKFKAEKSIPIVVAMRGMATSGGYYAACGADWIVAERTTLTGNIGVLMPQYNIHKLLDKYGIEDNTVVATGATFKDAGSPTRAPNPEHAAYFQSEIDAAFTIFKKVVTDSRGKKLSQPIAEIANGKAYNGEEALQLGLIDEVDDAGYLDAAIRYAKKQANLAGPVVTEYHEPAPSLFNLLSSNYAASRPNAGGVTINLDASLLDRISSPRMMYLYHGAPDGDVAAPAMK